MISFNQPCNRQCKDCNIYNICSLRRIIPLEQESMSNNLNLTTLTKNDYKKFVSLVKRMREAQKKFGGEVDVCIGFEEGLDKMYYLEDKVDELLKNIEV